MRDQSRAMMWGFVFPAFLLVAALAVYLFIQVTVLDGTPELGAAAILGAGFMIYVIKAATIALKLGPFKASSWTDAFLKTYGFFPESGGVMRYWFNRRPAPKR